MYIAWSLTFYSDREGLSTTPTLRHKITHIKLKDNREVRKLLHHMHLPIGYYNLYTLLNSEAAKRKEKKGHNNHTHTHEWNYPGSLHRAYEWHVQRPCSTAQQSQTIGKVKGGKEYISASSKVFPLVSWRQRMGARVDGCVRLSLCSQSRGHGGNGGYL